MKKEREILLAPEEIQQLLEGGLYWKDISARLSPVKSTDQDMDMKEELDLEEVTRSLTAASEDEEEKSLRAILFGEDKKYTESAAEIDFNAEPEPEPEPDFAAEKDTPIRKEDEVVINRQIDLSRMEADLKAQSPSDLKTEPILNDPEVDNEFKSILNEQNNVERQQDQETELDEEEESTAFGGLKLIILLIVVAALTFAFWYYFLDL